MRAGARTSEASDCLRDYLSVYSCVHAHAFFGCISAHARVHPPIRAPVRIGERKASSLPFGAEKGARLGFPRKKPRCLLHRIITLPESKSARLSPEAPFKGCWARLCARRTLSEPNCWHCSTTISSFDCALRAFGGQEMRVNLCACKLNPLLLPPPPPWKACAAVRAVASEVGKHPRRFRR